MSLKARIIPCLDVKNGRVVKGVLICEKRRQGDMNRYTRRYPNGETQCDSSHYH